MHNRLVKQERSIGMGRMISPQCGIAQPKSGFPIDGTRPSRAVPHRDPRDLRRPRLLGVTSTARARGQVLTACWPTARPVVEADIEAMGEIRLMVASGPD